MTAPTAPDATAGAPPPGAAPPPAARRRPVLAPPPPRGVTLAPVPGGVCAVPGVAAAGVRAGLKPSGRPDLALVAAPRTVAAAVVQTTNRVRAAPVALTARHAADGRARAVVMNAGNANACTGPDGDAAAAATATAVAAALGCPAADVLVGSTGVIGVPMPVRPVLEAVPGLVAALTASPEASAAAARAIMTTDTVPKQAAVRAVGGPAGGHGHAAGGHGHAASDVHVVGGVAKGAGMIAPELATMLCVLATDAAVDGPALHDALAEAVDATFGRIDVDGCRSTNDMVALLATGDAGPPRPDALLASLTAVCADLAEQVVRDGEGVTRTLTVRVTGAAGNADALTAARAVAGSALVKTALAGGDPNWGRVLAAAGAAPVDLDPGRVTLAFRGAGDGSAGDGNAGDGSAGGDGTDAVVVCRGGVLAPHDPVAAAAAVAAPAVALALDLGLGDGEATVLTCDLTHAYVTINAEYTT